MPPSRRPLLSYSLDCWMVYVFSRKRWKLLVRYQEAIRYRAYTIRRELFEVPLSFLPREVLAPSTLFLPRVWHSTYIELKGYKSRFFHILVGSKLTHFMY